MVHLILTGATGLVGSSALSHILSLPATSQPQIHRLSILTRNTSIPWLSSTPPTGTPSINKHTQIEVIEHRDFGSYGPEVLAKLKGADACIWALGVSQNDVSTEQYVTITRDYALEAAKAFSSLRDPASTGTDAKANDTADARKFRFIYVSGEGATWTPRAWTAQFGRVKGETERALIQLGHQSPFDKVLSVYAARPGAVDGHNQPWLWAPILREKRSGFQRFYLKALMASIRVGAVGQALHSPTEELGRVLVELAMGEGKGEVELEGGEGEDGADGRVLSNKVLGRWGRGRSE